MEGIKHVATLKEFEDFLNLNSKVIVDFHAEWCGPCKRIAPFLEQKAIELKNIAFLKVDVDQGAEISEKEGIQSMPTFKLYQKGKLVQTVVGSDEKKLEAALNNFNSK